MGTSTARPIVLNNHEDWIDERLKHLGASDLPTILGINPFQSEFSLWAEKRGMTPSKDESTPMRLGHQLEDPLHARYEQDTGRKLSDPGEFTIYVHPEHEFLACTPDRIEIATGMPVEFKTIGHYSKEEYEPDEDGSGGFGPLTHQVQLQAQMAILGQDKGSLMGALRDDDLLLWIMEWLSSEKNPIADPTFYTFDFDRNDRVIDGMLPVLEEFWECVQSGKEPKIDGSVATAIAIKALHPNDNGERIEANTSAAYHMEMLKLYKETIKTAEEGLDIAKNQITAYIGDNTFLDSDIDNYSYKTQSRKGTIKVEEEFMKLLEAADIPFKHTPASTHRALIKLKPKA